MVATGLNRKNYVLVQAENLKTENDLQCPQIQLQPSYSHRTSRCSSYSTHYWHSTYHGYGHDHQGAELSAKKSLKPFIQVIHKDKSIEECAESP